MKFPYESVILASQSSARKKLLESVGLHVISMPTFCDESFQSSDYREATKEIALKKLHSCIDQHTHLTSVIIAADTMVRIGTTILGKPINRDDAYRQLSLLSSKVHSVCSGYAIFLPHLKRIYSGYSETCVTFRPLTQQDITNYLDTNEYIGAAASYRIQERGKELISSIDGQISTVVGLPMIAISAILMEPEHVNYQEYPPQGEK